MTGLDMLRRDLGRPDLTAEQAERLMENPECVWGMNQAARFRYERGWSVAEIARKQGCSRGPAQRRIRVWLQRAEAMLNAMG